MLIQLEAYHKTDYRKKEVYYKMALSDARIKSAKPTDKRYMMGDGDTLYLGTA
jgi:hypothetical protein